MYNLGTLRGYLPQDGEKSTEIWGNNYIFSTEDVELSGRFLIMGNGDACHIFNTTLGKYLSANGYEDIYVTSPDGTFTIYASTVEDALLGREGMWIIKSNETGDWLMFGGQNQFLNSDDWKTVDDGDIWTIKEATVVDGIKVPVTTDIRTQPTYNLQGQTVGS